VSPDRDPYSGGVIREVGDSYANPMPALQRGLSSDERASRHNLRPHVTGILGIAGVKWHPEG